jgi:hypothetical protein
MNADELRRVAILEAGLRDIAHGAFLMLQLPNNPEWVKHYCEENRRVALGILAEASGDTQ